MGQVADHVGEVIGKLTKKPAVIGHSFGGLLAQIIAGRGLSAASVAIDPAPFRGVPLPISPSAMPVLGNPLNRGRAATLTLDQFRYAYPIRSRMGISWICTTRLQNAKYCLSKRFIHRWQPLETARFGC